MKTLIRKPRWFLIAALLFIAAMACNKDDDVPVDTTDYGVINVASMQTKVDALPTESINDDELSSLIFIREEEKLARDVYQALSLKYNAKIFTNIALAEQTHMDAVLILLNRYDMEDPVGTNPAGVFTDPILQFPYDELIAVGNTGILNAYKVALEQARQSALATVVHVEGSCTTFFLSHPGASVDFVLWSRGPAIVTSWIPY